MKNDKKQLSDGAGAHVVRRDVRSGRRSISGSRCAASHRIVINGDVLLPLLSLSAGAVLSEANPSYKSFTGGVAQKHQRFIVPRFDPLSGRGI